jgi:serine/threonine-protein kinase
MDAYHAYLRGWDLVERGYTPETWRLAVQMFERAVAQDPRFHQAYFALSRTHSGFSHFAWDRSPERLAKAKAAADKALELDPESPWSYMALGYYHYWGKKEYEPALQAFMTAEKKLENNTEVQEAIANVRRRQGDFEGALAYYRKAMDLDPRSGGKIYNVAETLSILHDYTAAEPLYDANISLDPDVQRGYNGKWWNRILMAGDPEDAGRILDACPAEAGSELAVNRFLNAYYSRDFSRAAELAAACPKVEGEQFYYYARSLFKGSAYAGMNDPGRARAEFDSARVLLEAILAEDPQDARAHSALGRAYAGLGRKEDAIREGRAGVDLFPESRDAWIYLSRLDELARIYAQTGEHEAAIDLLENLLGRPGNTVSPALLRVSPVYDPLRENPRFRKLVEEPL